VAINIFLNVKQSDLVEKREESGTKYVSDDDFFEGFLND
jgi:hypothetical protein